MGKVQDFDELRKRRDKKKSRRRTAIAAILAVTIALSVLGLQLFISSGASVKLDAVIARLRGGPGFPVAAPGGKLLRADISGSGLALLTDTGLYEYGSDGRQHTSLQHGMTNPAARFSQNRVLLYDRGSVNLSVYGKGKQIFKKSYDYPIFTAALSKYGDIAVVTGSQQHAGEITVYTPDFEEKFKWYSSGGYVTGISLSTLGDMVAFSSMGAREGALVSTVHVFGFKSEDELVRAEYEDAAVYSVSFKGDGGIHIITSRFAVALDSKGKELGRYDFGNAPLSYFSDTSPFATVIVLGNPAQDNRGELISLDLECGEQGSLEIGYDPEAIKADSGYIYILGKGKLFRYDLLCEPVSELESGGAMNFAVSGNDAYLVSDKEIWLERRLAR